MNSYVHRKAFERAPAPLLDAAGRAILAAVDRAVDQRWDRALVRAHEASGETLDERLKAVTKTLSRELVSLGAATGAAAAAPGLGTAGAVSMLVAEVGWFGLRATDQIMTIGALYGRVESTPDERRAWVLSVLAFGEQAAEEFVNLLGEVDHEVAMRSGKVAVVLAGIMQGDKATVDTLRRVNTMLAARVMAKYGSNRGMVTLGRLLPFGVGAVIGGGVNWTLSRALTRQSRRFFDGYHLLVTPPPPRLLPPPTPPSAQLVE
ncbi:MAG: EcsC family protein [Actinomycetia bacterium]|nr:EcsC family protein [Actinomycetes bacterium]MCP4223922.1 EcsC family protein [Actinomycetes bacterium]MCP5031503.1 EcsC family protein [Actinomycetes bacterium]